MSWPLVRPFPVNTTTWLTSRNYINHHKASWSDILTYLRSPYLSEQFHSQPGVELCTSAFTSCVPEPWFERLRLASKKRILLHTSPRLSEVSLSEIDFQECFSSLSSVKNIKNPQTSQTCNGKSSKHWNRLKKPNLKPSEKNISFWRIFKKSFPISIPLTQYTRALLDHS